MDFIRLFSDDRTVTIFMLLFEIASFFVLYGHHSLMDFIQRDTSQLTPELNDAPIIGVLAQELDFPEPGLTCCYIPACYVKFLEAGGARVVPVLINQTLEEYKTLFNSINGIVLPGGHVNITTSQYRRVAKIFYDLAIEARLKGDYFPILGTCMGFQMLVSITSGQVPLTPVNTHGVTLPLTFIEEPKKSRMFKGFPDDLLEELATKPIAEHSHVNALSLKSYNNIEELKNFYKLLVTNSDGNIEFVSNLEAYDFPIYATQWHPEKSPFEWTFPYIPHTRSAVKTNFYMADFFVSEARKSHHRFKSEEEERKVLIYNYNPKYLHFKFEQMYYF